MYISMMIPSAPSLIPRSEDIQRGTGKCQRVNMNNSNNYEMAELKLKGCPPANVALGKFSVRKILILLVHWILEP